MTTDLIDELADDLRRLSVNLPRALAETTVPAIVLDMVGVVRWMNAAALETFGDQRGKHYPVLVAPEWLHVVQQQFARKIVGARSTAYEAVFLAPDGRRLHVDTSTRYDSKTKVKQSASSVTVAEASGPVHLTPRQLEVLSS